MKTCLTVTLFALALLTGCAGAPALTSGTSGITQVDDYVFFQKLPKAVSLLGGVRTKTDDDRRTAVKAAATYAMARGCKFIALASKASNPETLAESLRANKLRWNNPVNKEIGETLKSEGRLHFVLMNNGITIVADSITRTGEQFTLEDFQIVNGCQTSHVIFHHRTELVNQIQVPVKLIVSKDRDIKNKIIKATNRQTLVKTEELTALTDFQKALEDYYDAIEGDSKLYYERRSQQFRSATGIEKMRVVSVPAQIRTFASMFLGLPHQASRYYGTLLNSIELTIFAPDHHPVAYYASSLALFRLESFMRRRSVDAKYRPFKYHLLSIVRSVIGGEQPSHLNSNKFEKYCEGIVKSLEDENKCILAFQKACEVLDQVLSGDYGRDKAKDASIHSIANKIA